METISAKLLSHAAGEFGRQNGPFAANVAASGLAMPREWAKPHRSNRNRGERKFLLARESFLRNENARVLQPETAMEKVAHGPLAAEAGSRSRAGRSSRLAMRSNARCDAKPAAA